MVLETKLEESELGVERPEAPAAAWWLQYWMALPIPVFLSALCLLASRQIDAVWNQPFLVPALNLCFGTVIIFVIVLAMMSYLAGRSRTILLFGCAMLALTLAGVGGAFYLALNNVESNMAIYGLMTALSASFTLASAASAYQRRPKRLEWGWPALLASSLVIAAIFFFLLALIQTGLIPTMYLEGTGLTFAGKAVYSLIMVEAVLAAVLLLVKKAPEESDFRKWFGLGLGLFATGIAGLLLQTRQGDPLNWLGRTGEYLAALYLLAAILASTRKSGEWVLPLEKALQESEEKFKLIFDSAAVGIVFSSPDGRILNCNSAFQELVGYRKEELAGKHFLEFTYQDDATKNVELKKQLIARQIDKFQLEKRYVRKDGRPVWARLTVSVISHPEGGLKNLLAIVEDISERKRAEEALRETRAQLLSIMDNSQDLLYRSDLKTGRYLYVSPAAESILGFSAGELMAMSITETMATIHPEDRTQAEAVMASVVAAGKGCWEYRVITKAGECRWLSNSMTIIRDEAGQPLYRDGVVQDITEHKQAEEDLKEAKQQAELYLDLLGHDISNIHQIALGQLELAHEILKEGGGLDHKAEEFISTPISTLQRSARLIDNVRKVQQLKAGQYKQDLIDLSQLLNDVVREYAEGAGKDVIITYTPGKSCFVSANPLLKDVFANLVDNAIKHSGSAPRLYVAVTRAEPGSYRTIVEDNGPGIPDERKEDVFRRFRRGQTTARGTGLGLYIVKTLVESLGGSVWVEDRVPGDHTKGARFVVLLPAVE